MGGSQQGRGLQEVFACIVQGIGIFGMHFIQQMLTFDPVHFDRTS